MNRITIIAALTLAIITGVLIWFFAQNSGLFLKSKATDELEVAKLSTNNMLSKLESIENSASSLAMNHFAEISNNRKQIERMVLSDYDFHKSKGLTGLDFSAKDYGYRYFSKLLSEPMGVTRGSPRVVHVILVESDGKLLDYRVWTTP